MTGEMRVHTATGFNLDLQQVTESTLVAQHPWLASNAAAVVFDNLIVAIDAGLRPQASHAFRDAVERTCRRPVKFVCVTHYHADHTFGLVTFKDCALLGSVQLLAALETSPNWSPDGSVRWKNSESGGEEWLDDVERVFPNILFEHHLEVVSGGRHLQLRASGGHTACSTYAYLPDEKVLLAGDLIFAGQMPFAGDETTDPEAWIAVLRSWLNLDIEWVIPGHGQVCGPSEIARHLEFFASLKERTLAVVEAGLSPDDITAPDTYQRMEQPWFWEKTRARWFSYYSQAAREGRNCP